MAPAGSQQFRAQNWASVRQSGTERRTGHQEREGRNGDGNRDGGGNEGRDGGENRSGNGGENRSGNGDEKREEDGGEREPRNLRSAIRGGSEDAKRGGGQRQGVTNSHSRKTRRPSETVASWDGRRGTWSGRTEERRTSVRNPRRVLGIENEGGSGGRRKKCRQESAGLVDVDPEDLENIIGKEAEREA